MIKIVLTLDYEVFGTGAGDPVSHLTGPTARLLAIADEFGVPVTLMVDAAQLLAWRREPALASAVAAVEEQLTGAVRAGHDVQLHLHPAWFRARRTEGAWELAYDEYALPGLPDEVVTRYVAAGAEYLTRLGRAADPAYRCVAFRAGGWLIQPSGAVTAALSAVGITLDTSVFAGGHGRTGRYQLDFRSAPDPVHPWRAADDDVARPDADGALTEVPIFARRVPLTAMLTPRRLAYQRRLVRLSRGVATRGAGIGQGRAWRRVRLAYPKKFDFCRLGLRELKSFVARAERLCRNDVRPVPVVAIGHSTEFTDEVTLARFLEHVRRHRPAVGFGLLREWA